MMTKKDVLYIASLSRIHLKEEEIEPLTKSLGDILLYVEKLKKLDVTDVQPTSHVLPLKNVFRKDIITESLSQSEALSIAIAKNQGCFKVPRVVE